MSGRIVIGTASWSDPGFVKEWYPGDLDARDLLPYYAQRFDGVEVNSTWYGVPYREAVARWADITPDGFTFDVKLHQAMTRHSAKPQTLPKDLRDEVALTPRGRVRPLAALDRELADRYVGAAFVAVDVPQGKPATLLPPIDAVTRDDLAYLRAHGRNLDGWVRGRSVAERFAYRYSDKELRQLDRRAEGMAEQAGSVRLMFNNNRGDDAPVAATRARELLGERAPA